MIKIVADDNGAMWRDSGVYLELCSQGRHGRKHRVLLIKPDGTLSDCYNVREMRFLIKNNSLNYVRFEDIQPWENEPDFHVTSYISGVTVSSPPYPGYPGRYFDPENRHHKRSPHAGTMIDNRMDRYLSTIGCYLVRRGVTRISNIMMASIHSRLFQWVGHWDCEGDTDAIASSVDSNEGDAEI